MYRRLRLAHLYSLCLTLLTGFPVFLTLPCLGGNAPRRPNVIFLLTDDQRWDTLGAYGNTQIQTPNLDRLAQEGVVFDNMFVTTSICASSRATILTGQYVRRHGIWDFQTELTKEELAETYLGRLKQAGYRLGFIGKWGVGNPPQNFFDFDRSFAGQGEYLVTSKGESRHLTSVMGDQAIEFLEGVNTDTPFCLSISFKAPHVQDSYDLGKDPFPFDPSLESLYADTVIATPGDAGCSDFDRLPAFLQNSENRMRWAVRFWGPARYQDSVKGYYRLISGVDVVVGRIVQALQESSLYLATIIIFSSDNGFFLGEKGLAGKWLPHEPSIRVPLVLFDPRLPRSLRNLRRSELVLNLDLAPTILALAQVKIPTPMQGSSLVPILHGKTVQWRTEFFYEHLYRHSRIPPTEAVRTKKWKYIRYISTTPVYEELFDLENDPREERNLAYQPEQRPQLLQMREKWNRWQVEAK